MSQAGQELGALKTKDEAGPEPQRWLPYEMSVLGQEAAGRMHGGFMVEGSQPSQHRAQQGWPASPASGPGWEGVVAMNSAG